MAISDQNPKIQQVAVDDIVANWADRLRPVTEKGVDSLVRSFTELGVMKDAIHLRRKGRGDGARLVLVAGGHRLSAALRLGWDRIPARVWDDLSDDDALLMEIDDNLAGADLSPLELSVFLAERKRVYSGCIPRRRPGLRGRWRGMGMQRKLFPLQKVLRKSGIYHRATFVILSGLAIRWVRVMWRRWLLHLCRSS